MASEFAEGVEAIVGPVLTDLGFTLDEIDDGPDKGGRPRQIVYYRSRDCKIQVYNSRREGEVNCMIAPLDAANEFGLNAKEWHFLDRFTERRSPPTAESVKLATAEYRSYANPVEWVRDRILKYYDDAHRGILAKYPEGHPS
ncbi:hypothetical protein OG976_04830 [Mycobacterium sp. NBC_00419]|uniref:hypothetical protein n=1 Tax=Mycobacterium sp. NBC_00419 TaxID=2975989 RepID=UPI002E245C5D